MLAFSALVQLQAHELFLLLQFLYLVYFIFEQFSKDKSKIKINSKKEVACSKKRQFTRNAISSMHTLAVLWIICKTTLKSNQNNIKSTGVIQAFQTSVSCPCFIPEVTPAFHAYVSYLRFLSVCISAPHFALLNLGMVYR